MLYVSNLVLIISIIGVTGGRVNENISRDLNISFFYLVKDGWKGNGIGEGAENDYIVGNTPFAV